MRRCLALLGFIVGCATTPPKPAPSASTPVPSSPTPVPSAPKAVPHWEKLAATLPSSDAKQSDKTFEELRKLADPRSADWLASFIAPEKDPRAKTFAAFALAELGDLRAVPQLVWRVKTKPAEDREEVLRRDAVRLLGDLADIHPDHRQDLMREAENAVLEWIASAHDPRADGLRFLARVRSTRGIAKLRVWADPKDPLPKPGTRSVPAAFTRARAALRWLGAAAPDDATRALLTKQLGRRPANLDATTDTLPNGDNGGLNMTLGALAIGAAYGFAEIGDPSIVPMLVAFAEDPKNVEYARFQTCFMVGLIATPQQLQHVATKITTFDGSDQKAARVTSCLMYAFDNQTSFDLSGVLRPLIAKGGDADLIAQAKKLLVLEGKESISTLAQPSSLASYLGIILDRELADGSYARQLRALRGDAEGWSSLHGVLRSVEFDSGPGSLPRVVARARLLRDARGADAKKRDDALLVLEAMDEQASIEAVTEE